MQKITIAFVAIILLLTGCGDPVMDQINKQIPLTEKQLSQLAESLDSGNVRNALLIKQYADTLEKKNASYTPLLNEFRKDASSEGPMFKALTERLELVKSQPQMFASSQARFEELLNIFQAANPSLYSDALSDPLNVLADLSQGELPRVNALSKEQSMRANNAQDFGYGEQLIGNPAYGQWQNDNSGTSFWVWYGMYRILDDVFDDAFDRKRKRRIYYNQWGKSRNYSYYSDFGRTRYSSPTQLRKQTQLDTRTRKSFESKGQKFTSAYSKNRTGASSMSSQSKTAQASANRFRSNTKAKSTYAKSSKSTTAKNASFRNSRSSTSRGVRRGK